MSLEQATKSEWLPSQVTSFLRELTTNGPLSDKMKLTPMIGCLLALAREPLTANDIGAFLVRALSPSSTARIIRDRGRNPFEHRQRIASEVLSDFGGLLRSSVDRGGDHRFRLLHEQLTQHLRTSDDVGDTLAETTELLIAAAQKPGNDALTPYLYRNGIAHIVLESPSQAGEAIHLLTGFAYQIRRLRVLTVSGGDGGLRDDWRMVSEHADEVDATARLWRKFWVTDGTYFQSGVGRDAPSEFSNALSTTLQTPTLGRAPLATWRPSPASRCYE